MRMPLPSNKGIPKGRKPPVLPPLRTDDGGGSGQQTSTPLANLDDKCSMTLNGVTYEVRAEELVRIKELGRGGYGIVETMQHPASGTIVAVKRIHVTVNNEEEKRTLIELNASMKSGRCPYMVRFYGAMFREGDVWICMEVMDTSLDKFYRMCVDQGQLIPEPVISFITRCVIEALHYMKEELKLMHRDVKPSNILINRKGEVKICDFGISGHLTDSVAKTINAGCKPYMAPERIDPRDQAQNSYDIRSDVWSLGITLIEIATGTHPYARWKTPFEQLKQVVMEPPPRLQAGRFSQEFVDFVDSCLKKEYRQRPKYAALLEAPFIVKHMHDNVDAAGFVNRILDSSSANEEFAMAAAANAAGSAFARQQIMQQGQPGASPTPPLSSDATPVTGSPSREVRLPQQANSPSPSAEENTLNELHSSEQVLSADS